MRERDKRGRESGTRGATLWQLMHENESRGNFGRNSKRVNCICVSFVLSDQRQCSGCIHARGNKRERGTRSRLKTAQYMDLQTEGIIEELFFEPQVL